MSFVRMNPQMTTLPAGTFFTEGVRILPGPPMVPHPQYKADIQKFVPGGSATTYLPNSTPLVYKTTPQITPQLTPTSQITSTPQIKKEIPPLVNNPPQVKQQSPPPQPPQNKPTVTTRSKAASPPPICTLTPQLPEYKFVSLIYRCFDMLAHFLLFRKYPNYPNVPCFDHLKRSLLIQ